MSQPVQGVLNLSDTTNTSGTTTASTLDFFAQSVAGYMMARVDSFNNATTSLQTNLGINRVIYIGPGNGTSISSIGTLPLTIGTISNPSSSATSILTSARALIVTSTTTAGTFANVRSPVTEFWRGNAAGLGGFFFVATFGISVLQSTNRAFVGISDSSAAPTAAIYGDPTTNTTPGKVGLAINTNTGNWNLVTNVSGTAPTVTALGANFPVNNSSLYQLILYSAPNGSNIQYQVTNISTGSVASGTLSTNIPASNTFLAIQAWITNNTTAAAVALSIPRIYLESDI